MLKFYEVFHILQLMKQVLFELDDKMAERLEEVAPARSRRRSEFIRSALRRALWEEEERKTAEAYARQPDSIDDAYLDPRVWDSASRYRTQRRKRS